MPTCFRQSTDDPSRIIFRAASRSNWIFDLKLINGQVRLWSDEEVAQGRAFGLQKRPFVRDIDFIDHNLISVLTLYEEGQWKPTNIVKDLKLSETLLQELPKVIKVPAQLGKFVFALSKQKIAIVNTLTGMEFTLVKQKAHCEHDCFDDLTITHRTDENGNVCQLTLYYFEKFFDY